MLKNSDKGGESSWRRLKRSKMTPKSKRAASSWRVRVRRLAKFAKWTAAVALLAAMGFGAYYAWTNFCVDDIFASNRIALKSIKFKSDGVIDAEWIGKILKIPKNSTISDVNIFHLKRLLEDISQIDSANVERVYPDIIKVEISEKRPMAKITAGVDFKRVLYLISTEGDLFRPVCYTPKTLDSLIYVEGAKFDFGKKIGCHEKLGMFLNSARTRFPKEVENWFSVDVSQIDSLTLPLVTVRTRAGTKIIFSLSDLEKQFDKFDYILRYSKQRSLNDFESIDLSIKDRAIAKLKKGLDERQ